MLSSGVVPLVLRVFLPFAAGYYLSYLYRSINAVIYPELVRDLGLSAGAMGAVTSAYLVVFAIVQLPLGLALDRFGPRRVDAALLLVAAGGAFAFSLAQSVEHLIVARALIGLGVSAALMASVKAFRVWFPARRLAGVNGWFFGFGGLGAMSATAPVEALLGLTGWRGVFQILAIVTVVVALAIWWLIPDSDAERSNESLSELTRGVATIARSRAFLRVGPLALTALGPSVALQGLWVAPWLRDNLGADRAAIANALLAMTIALALGFTLFGVMLERLARRGWSPLTVIGVATGVSTLCLAMLALGPHIGAVALWVVYFFSVGSVTTAYAILARQFPADWAGRVNTLFNLTTFGAAFAVQLGVGPILQWWPMVDGRHPPIAYTVVLAALVVAQVAALVWLALAPRAGLQSH